jgi:hypothetical protein
LVCVGKALKVHGIFSINHCDEKTFSQENGPDAQDKKPCPGANQPGPESLL